MDYNEIIQKIAEETASCNNLKKQKEVIEEQINASINNLKLLSIQAKKIRYSQSNPHEITYQPQYKSGPYDKYKDPHWLAVKEIVLARDNNICQRCLVSKAREVHHIDYVDDNYRKVNDEIWLSPLSHLVSLCKNCHDKFDGIKCEDTIFIPSSHPIRISKYMKCNRIDLPMINPKWEEVSEKLRHHNLRYDYSRKKQIILAILYPEATQLGRELLLLQEKNGLNELDIFIRIHRFSRGYEIFNFGQEILRLRKECPSVARNCDYVLNKIAPLVEKRKEIPNRGIIHFTSKSKSKGYFICLYDIEKKAFVAKYDMSKVPEFCNCKNFDYKLLGQFYAIKYVMDRCIELNENTWDFPIFPNDPNGDLSYIDGMTVKEDIGRIQDKSIYRLVEEQMDKIDFSKFYLYVESWDEKLWGDIPTKKYRNKKITSFPFV